MLSVPVVTSCNNGTEDLDHLFRRCNKSFELWGHIMGSRLWRDRFDSPVSEWISFHLKSKRHATSGKERPWNTVFCATLWQIWKDRNRKSFDNIDAVTSVASKVILSYADEIDQAFKSPLYKGFTRSILIKWKPPCAGKIKLNTDGCRYQSSRNAGFGGIFRDANGE